MQENFNKMFLIYLGPPIMDLKNNLTAYFYGFKFFFYDSHNCGLALDSWRLYLTSSGWHCLVQDNGDNIAIKTFNLVHSLSVIIQKKENTSIRKFLNILVLPKNKFIAFSEQQFGICTCIIVYCKYNLRRNLLNECCTFLKRYCEQN